MRQNDEYVQIQSSSVYQETAFVDVNKFPVAIISQIATRKQRYKWQ